MKKFKNKLGLQEKKVHQQSFYQLIIAMLAEVDSSL